jgi:hypothetical protein
MQAKLLERYEALPEWLKTWSMYKIRDFRDKKINENTPEAVLKAFEKKLDKCEEKQKEGDEYLPQLLEKRNYVQSILSSEHYDDKALSAECKRSLTAAQGKLKHFKWDGDTLLEGKPFKKEVSEINTEHLKKTWEKLVPQPITWNAKKFETFVAQAKPAMETFWPIFLQKVGGEKLEEWNAVLKETEQKFAERPDDTIDVTRLEAIYRHLQSFIPKKKEEKKKKKRDWTAVRSEYLKRASAPQFKSNKKGQAKFEQLDDLWQEAYEEKNTAKMEKYYAKIDELLPKPGTFEESVLATAYVPKSEFEGSIAGSSEDEFDDEEEDEEDEEEDYESSSSFSSVEEVKTKKRSRSEGSLGNVLNIFSGFNKHIAALNKIYQESGDGSEFESELKKTKETLVPRFQVKVYGANGGTFIPCLPNGSIFFNQEEAEEVGKDYIKLFELNGKYEYKVVELAPGEEPHRE